MSHKAIYIFSASLCKLRWEYIHDKYIREAAKVAASERSGCGTSDVFKPKWAYFESCRFLTGNSIVSRRYTRNNLNLYLPRVHLSDLVSGYIILLAVFHLDFRVLHHLKATQALNLCPRGQWGRGYSHVSCCRSIFAWLIQSSSIE